MNPNDTHTGKITESDDATRCQAVIPTGQCDNKCVEGTERCALHGANKQLAVKEAASLKNYRLTKFKAQVARMANNDALKSLGEEIGILRVIMEERLNQCNDAQELMMQSQTIGDLAMKIEKLVVSCSKLESSLGQTMDKAALLTFAGQVIQIIGDNISDPEVLDIIGNQIVNLMGDEPKEG